MSSAVDGEFLWCHALRRLEHMNMMLLVLAATPNHQLCLIRVLFPSLIIQNLTPVSSITSSSSIRKICNARTYGRTVPAG